MHKALSTIVASVILVIIVVGVSVILMTWVKDYTKSTTTKIESSDEQLMECGGSEIKIADIWLNNNSGNISVKMNVRNVGHQKLRLMSASVYNTTGSSCSFNVSYITLDLSDSASLEKADCNIINASCNNFDKAEVTTQCSIASDTFTKIEGIKCNVG